MEFREESDAAVEKHRAHIERDTSATIKEGHELLRKLKLAERDEHRALKREPLQDTPLTSRMPLFGSAMQRAAVENYRNVERKRKATNGCDAAAIAVGSTSALHAPTGMPLAQYRMTQQHQQMMMCQQAMQQQNMANSLWMGAHSAPSYTTPQQNEWANFGAGNQSNFNMNNVLPQQHLDTKANVPTSEVGDVLSNEDAAAILALVEKESERSTSAAILPAAATPSTNAASQNFPYIASLNTGPSQATRRPDFPLYDGTMTTQSQAMGSGQQDKSTPAAYWSYY